LLDANTDDEKVMSAIEMLLQCEAPQLQAMMMGQCEIPEPLEKWLCR